MPQSISQKPVNTFVGGLVTEASPLTFPENASVDELNCDLKRTGVRSRRRGIEFEEDFTLSSFTVAKGSLVHELTWENVSKETGVEFLVLQVGAILYFYDKSSVPLSGGVKSSVVNLNSFSAGNGLVVSEHRISGSSINGQFVLCSPAIETIVLSFDTTTEVISSQQINPKIRDFEWQGDTTTYNVSVSAASVTDARKYDTHNAGWINSKASKGVLSAVTGLAYPALTHPWFTSKNSDGNFDYGGWLKIGAGNTLIGNGHFILDLYSKDRTAALASNPDSTATISLPVETETARFSTVAAFAGRVWLSGLSSTKNGSRVFFSKVIENDSDFDKFYQVADPTAEDISDLIDTDGGVVNIPEANKITALFTWSSSILVFAENGVWEIKGIDNVFKATEFAVARVRNTDGLTNPAALVNVEGTPLWWGRTGIFTVVREDISQGPDGRDLTKDTIQTFWQDIGASFRAEAKGVYDALNKRIFWLYGSDSVTANKFNNVLIFDITLGAFFPWAFEDEASNTNYVVGATYFEGFGAADTVLDVFADTDDVVQDADDVVVTVSSAVFNDQTEVKFIVRDGTSGKLTFATLSNTDFLDWGTESYSSYAEAGYDFTGDLTTYKNSIYITCYFNVTETGFTGNDTTGYNALNPSGCFLKAFWDQDSSASSNRQVYRFNRPITVDTGNLGSFNYPNASVVTRNRIRGRGRVLKLRFESEEGKDFQLQGYEVINAKNNGF